MKTTIKQNGMWPAILMALMLIVTISCSKDTEPTGEDKEQPISGEEADKINTYVANLSYDSDELLNVQTDTGSSQRNISDDKTTSLGRIQECRVDEHNIRSNFEDVAIFDPALGVVYPGALVIGNHEMLDGAPQPLQISKAPVKLRLDLPGIGEGGNIEIEDPTYSNVQSGIDAGLEYWNDEIASRAYYESTTTYSSEQMSLDLGVSAEWVSGSSFESQFSYDTSTSKRVAAILYRQVFYDVVMETPNKPSDVFGSDVDLAKIEAVMGSSTPPAYVSSVSYGRIIMVRMETTSTETSVELEAALEYASLGKDVEADIEAKYKSILEESTINVVTIGGNAEVASQVITGSTVASSGGLNYVITEGSLYSRDNPGAPIAYTVKYLKDNQVAKMGYNTDYRIESCQTYDVIHKNAKLRKKIIADVRFRFAYKKKGSQTEALTGWKKADKQNIFFSKAPPNGAHDVKIQFQYWDIVWKTLGEQSLGYLNSEKCYEAYCSKTFLGVCTQYTFKSVSCN